MEPVDKAVQNPLFEPCDSSEDDMPELEPAQNPTQNPTQNPKIIITRDLQRRFDLIRSVGEECTTDTELMELLRHKTNPIAYDGFEPSGKMHLAQGLLKAWAVNRMTDAGCKFIFWVADWFALMNNKMDGDLKKIQTAGNYMIEIWKACGMRMENVEFRWASTEIAADPNYWTRVIDIASKNSVTRITRCSQIMGRSDVNLSAAQIMYPCMQCADVFFLKADICQLGMDQRKVNMLAREYVDSGLKSNTKSIRFKPVILSHRMLPGLLAGQEKASKSVAGSAIFMDDDEATVNGKVKRAFCPPAADMINDPELVNPVLDYAEHLVMKILGRFTVVRKYANTTVYSISDELREDYIKGLIHPEDLKINLAVEINALLLPVRRNLAASQNAVKLGRQVHDILKKMKPVVISAPVEDYGSEEPVEVTEKNESMKQDNETENQDGLRTVLVTFILAVLFIYLLFNQNQHIQL